MSENAQTSHSKVFISYSRKDTDFTRKLYGGLEKHDLITWVDWEGIPLTADWMAEITAAIESADSFIFIISPDSIDSEVCGHELEIALENNKRLVPVLHRMPTKKQMDNLNETLSATNWVYMRETDNFDKALEGLVDALNTDLDWVKSHTRIQEKALEWERKERDGSFTLRGNDLGQAEQWLATASDEKVPLPTFLQNEYIIVSRQDETRRQRRTLTIVAFLLVAAIVASIFAVNNMFIAQAQTRKATSRQLAAQAINSFDSSPDLAMLLSIESFNADDLLESRTSLLSALAEYPQLETMLHDHTGAVRGVAYSSDGSKLFTVGDDDLIIVWDDETNRPINMIDSHHTGVTAVDANPDGSVVATADASGGIILWNADTLEEVARLNAHSGTINELAYSSSGTWLASAGQEGSLILWHSGENQPRFILTDLNGPVLSIAFSEDGQYLAAGGTSGMLMLYEWDVQNGPSNPVLLEGHTDEVNAVAFQPGTDLLYSAGRDTNIYTWDATTGQLVSTFENAHDSNILALAFSADGSLLASGGEDKIIYVWEAASDGLYEIEVFAAHTNWINDLAFSPIDDTLVSASFDTKAILWRTAFSGYGPMIAHSAALRRVEYSTTGAYLATAGQDDTVLIWDLATMDLTTDPIDVAGSVFGLSWGANDSTLVIGTTGGSVDVISMDDPADFTSYSGFGSAVYTLDVSADGQWVAIAGGQTYVQLWSPETGKTRELHPNAEPSSTYFIRWVAFSPQGSMLATLDGNGELVIWDVASGEKITEVIAHPDSLGLSVEFSPDGFLVATSGSDAKVVVYTFDGTNLNRKYVLDGHSDWVHAVSFNPDATILASSSEDNAIILWDLSTGDQIATLTGHEASANTVDFNMDGDVLVSGSSDMSFILWDVDLGHARAALCHKVNRNMTHHEWEDRIEDAIDYHGSCPDLPIPED